MYKSNSKEKHIKKPNAALKNNKFKISLALLIIIALAFSVFTVNSSANERASDIFHRVNPERRMLYPGGMPFGVRFNTKGLIIVGISEVPTEIGSVSPARTSGLRVGDIITFAGDDSVNTPEELTKSINRSSGRELSLKILRSGKERIVNVTPVKSSDDGNYRLGLFVRCECAGIGTVSYIIPESLDFAGLGHGVCDRDSGALIPFLSGNVTNVIISEVIKGKCGIPGELHGHLGKMPTGTLSGNLKTGIYGKFEKLPEELFYSSPIPAAFEDEVKEGKAEILCTTSSNKICKYEILIECIDFKDVRNKNFSIRITDKKLISETGGIVQGMSGSPIIQDGKLIGAVTHVLVDDPATGYGIFIENMLDAENIPQPLAS